MKWIKINPEDLIPFGNLLVTDGNEIAVQFNGIRSSISLKMKNWTHYIMFDDIELPEGPKE